MEYAAYMTDPRDEATYSPDEEMFNNGYSDAMEGFEMESSNRYYINGYRKAVLESGCTVQQKHQDSTNPDWF